MNKSQIIETKLYSLAEAGEILGYSQDHKNQGIRYLIKKGHFDGFVKVVGGTPEFPRRMITGEGILKYVEKREGKIAKK